MTVDIVRAWKDPEYRKSLSPEELASLPPNPAVDPELTSKELEGAAGGMTKQEFVDQVASRSGLSRRDAGK
jgi:mersacidin/lichenicidin family type 2 lantibiotic